ncbi:MAG: fibronectin type III domain-containing protein, partial [ANME-2 cluster archaeon]|nr:fibronectin type III domain-containing protein [ANME-2 cluster archaeon]
MDGINLNRNIISLIILFCIVFHSTIVVAAEDPDPLPGQVLFGAIEYAFGETMKIIFQGILDSNDEIWLFYNPTGYKVKIFDPDGNLYFGNEVVYYTPQSSGNWHAQFVVDTNYLPWEENWVPIFDSYTYVRPALTTDLQQTGSTLNSISLSWSYPTDPGVDKYDVEVKQSGQNTGTQYAINDYQKATINNLKSGTLYDIRVRPVDISGNVGDWTDYVTMSTENILPIAAIDYITPSNSYEGNKVSFKGTGNDPDGTIESYKWWSDKDEVLSYSNTFSTTSLSPGSHTIFFKVKDNTNAWSDVVSRSITVNEITPSPSVNISSSKEYPDKDESYKVKVMIENSGGSASGKLYLYENNVLLQVQDISVPKGSQISRTFTRSQSSPEKYEYKAEVVLSNGAGSRSSVKTAYVYVYSGTESINLDKDEYYYNHDTKCSKVALARALNIHPDLPYNVKWYNDVTLKYDLILTGDESKRSIPGKVGDKIKVELTKPNGNVIDSDNAIIVVEPLNLKIGVIL